MTEAERLVADYAGTGLSIGRHPMALRRDELAMRGILRASDLHAARQGRRVRVAGMVITRQRPGTAKGFVFLTLEDETGIANIIVRPDLFARDRLVIVEEPFLLVDGVLQSQDGVTSVRAEEVSRPARNRRRLRSPRLLLDPTYEARARTSARRTPCRYGDVRVCSISRPGHAQFQHSIRSRHRVSASNSVWHRACPVIRRRTKPAPDFGEQPCCVWNRARRSHRWRRSRNVPIQVLTSTMRLQKLVIDRPAIVAYFQSIPADKQEIALVHALEVGVTELGRGEVSGAARSSAPPHKAGLASDTLRGCVARAV